jgi:hypothetical protein
MKRLLTLVTLASLIAALGGCVVVPLGYSGDRHYRGHEHSDWGYRGYGDGYRWRDR